MHLRDIPVSILLLPSLTNTNLALLLKHHLLVFLGEEEPLPDAEMVGETSMVNYVRGGFSWKNVCAKKIGYLIGMLPKLASKSMHLL